MVDEGITEEKLKKELFHQKVYRKIKEKRQKINEAIQEQKLRRKSALEELRMAKEKNPGEPVIKEKRIKYQEQLPFSNVRVARAAKNIALAPGKGAKKVGGYAAEKGKILGKGALDKIKAAASKLNGWTQGMAPVEGGKKFLSFTFNKFTFFVILTVIFLGFSMGYTRVIEPAGGISGIIAEGKISGEKTGIVDMIRAFYNKQFLIATGQYQEGETKEEKEYIEITIEEDPLTPNIRTYDEGEHVELNTMINVFSKDKVMNLDVSCNWRKAVCKGLSCPQHDINDVSPKKIKGVRESKKVFCTPGTSLGAGNNIVTFEVLAKDIETTAYLENYFVDAENMNIRLNDYTREHEIKSNSDLYSALKTLYPSVTKEIISKSDPGPVKLVLVTNKMPVIGIKEESDLSIIAGIENSIEGYVKKIKAFEIELPDGFAKGFRCPAYNLKGNKLILKQSYLKANFSVARFDYKSFPSCELKVKDASKLIRDIENPNKAIFYAKVKYDYLVKKEFRVTYGDEPEWLDPSKVFEKYYDKEYEVDKPKKTSEYMAIYGSSAPEVRAQLVTVNFMGKNVQFHKKAAPALRNVVKNIKKCPEGRAYKYKSLITFSWRRMVGGKSLSRHSFGIAIDINPADNPMCPHQFDPKNLCGGKNILVTDLPKCVIDAFEKNDFAWGGRWRTVKDAMHFQYQGAPAVV